MGQIAVGEDRGMCVKRHCKSYSPLQRIPPTSTVIDWSYGRTPADYDEKLILDGTLALAIRLPFANRSDLQDSWSVYGLPYQSAKTPVGRQLNKKESRSGSTDSALVGE